jgi:hypothetical protein
MSSAAIGREKSMIVSRESDTLLSPDKGEVRVIRVRGAWPLITQVSARIEACSNSIRGSIRHLIASRREGCMAKSAVGEIERYQDTTKPEYLNFCPPLFEMSRAMSNFGNRSIVGRENVHGVSRI